MTTALVIMQCMFPSYSLRDNCTDNPRDQSMFPPMLMPIEQQIMCTAPNISRVHFRSSSTSSPLHASVRSWRLADSSTSTLPVSASLCKQLERTLVTLSGAGIGPRQLSKQLRGEREKLIADKWPWPAWPETAEIGQMGEVDIALMVVSAVGRL